MPDKGDLWQDQWRFCRSRCSEKKTLAHNNGSQNGYDSQTCIHFDVPVFTVASENRFAFVQFAADWVVCGMVKLRLIY